MTEMAAVEQLGWIAIAKSQPDGKLPMWILLNATTSKVSLGDGVWDLSVYLFKKRTLATNEAWERQADGSKISSVPTRTPMSVGTYCSLRIMKKTVSISFTFESTENKTR